MLFGVDNIALFDASLEQNRSLVQVAVPETDGERRVPLIVLDFSVDIESRL